MLLSDLVTHLTEPERAELRRRTSSGETLVARLTTLLLEQPDLTRSELAGRLGTTAGTFQKVHSQALDAAYEMIRTTLNNPYDPIMLVRKLLLMGLPGQARRLYTELEREYAREMRYAVLDTLYHEGVRLAYDAGDARWLAELETQVNRNSGHLLRYNRIDKGLARLMLQLERARTRCGPAVGREVARLHVDATRLGHPVLIINALYCRHIFHLRHRYDSGRALDALAAIMATTERYRENLDTYSHAIAAANYASFICTYNVDESPDRYFRVVEKIIGEGGTLGPLITGYQRLRHAVTVGDMKSARRLAERIDAITDHNRFSPMKSAAAAWIAFGENDSRRFREATAGFYTTPNYQDVPEQEFELRAIDLLLMLREERDEEVIRKGETLRKFVERHFTEPQRSECSQLLQRLLHRAAARNGTPRRRHTVPPNHTFMLRSHAFIAGQIDAELTVGG